MPTTKTKSAPAKSKPSKTVTAGKQKPSKTVTAGKQKPSKAGSKAVGNKAAGGKVTIDRRIEATGRRKSTNRRKKAEPVVAERRTIERRAKVNRRRQIDPTTCERDYSGEELEFMGALDKYKRASGRMFPTCSEVLEVIRGLGYEKRREETDTVDDPTAEQQADISTGPPIDVTDGERLIDPVQMPIHASVPLGLE